MSKALRMRLRFAMQGPGLAMAGVGDGSTTLWAKIETRKLQRCVVCLREKPRGSEMYRPITEGPPVQRWMRACLTCVESNQP